MFQNKASVQQTKHIKMKWKIQNFLQHSYKIKQMLKKRNNKLVEKQQFDETKEVKSLMTEGKLMYEKATRAQNYEEASKLFTQAISKSSSAQILHLNHIYHLRGLCELKLKNYEKAQRDFQQAISISDDKSKIQFYNSLGKCKLQQLYGQQKYLQPASVSIQLEQAIKCFQKALEFSNRTDGQAYFNLGMIHRKLRKNTKAIEYFDQAIKNLKHQDQYSVYIQRGICYRDIGLLESSINDFLKALQIQKDDPFANFHLGINYLMNFNYDGALEKLSAAIELNKTQPQFYNYKGLVLYMSGQYELCLSAFHDALKLYEQKKVRTSQVGECWYNLGNAKINLQKYDKALQSFQKAKNFKIDQQLQIKLLYAKGRTYQLLNSIQSIPTFTQAINRMLMSQQQQQNDLYLAALYHLGCCQSKYQQYLQAIESFSKIIQSDCNDKCVYEQRGKAYLKCEMYEKALRDFEVVVGIDQFYPDVYFYRGMSKIYLQGDNIIDEALKDFFRAIQLGSKHIGIYNGISCAYLQAKKYQKALIYSNICLSQNQNMQQFLVQRSLIYLQLKQYKKSIEDLTTALNINNKNPVISYRRGLAYYKNNQYEKAINDLDQSLMLSPPKNIQSDIYYHIGIAYSNLEKYQQAVDPLTKAIALQPKPKYYHQRAKCLLLIEDNLHALNDLNQVIKAQPNNAFAFFRRGFAHKALKLYEQAAEDFLKARDLNPDDPRLIINKKQIYQTKYRKLCEAGEQL